MTARPDTSPRPLEGTDRLLLESEVAAFLYREARLLDAGAYDAWLELLTEDIHYWMPVVENRLVSDPAGAFDQHRMAFFDDRLRDLKRRVVRFNAPSAWPEDPRTRHLHVVTNIELEHTGDPDEWLVHSAVVNYRNSRETDEAALYARREDLLRRVDGELRLARRTVVLRQNLLLAKNINTFL